MRFTPNGATSIDLHIHETIRWSRFREETTVYAQAVADPFDDVHARFWAPGTKKGAIAAMVRDQAPDLVVVHQHLPMAASLARMIPRVPVALIRHNFQKPPGNRLSRFVKRRQFSRLAEIAFVSNCCAQDFRDTWSGVDTPVGIVLNGVDEQAWRPAATKEPLIVFTGRLAPEKGALEAAEAMVDAVSTHEGWYGTMIFSAFDPDDPYARQVRAVLARAGGRIDTLVDVPHDTVRDRLALAAIALAPTLTREPFGRVAIEAMASGAVLIASNRGGFVEIVGKNGVLLDNPDTAALTAALDDLIGNAEKRETLAVDARAKVISCYDLATTAATFDAMVDRHCRIGSEKR